MKSFHHLLRISGYAFLHDILTVGEQMKARVKAQTHFNPTSQGKDDLWIDMVIDNFYQKQRLTNLIQSVKDGKNVMITFETEYDLLLEVYSGQAKDDPNHIVMLSGKLLKLGDCYIDGCLINEPT